MKMAYTGPCSCGERGCHHLAGEYGPEDAPEGRESGWTGSSPEPDWDSKRQPVVRDSLTGRYRRADSLSIPDGSDTSPCD